MTHTNSRTSATQRSAPSASVNSCSVSGKNKCFFFPPTKNPVWNLSCLNTVRRSCFFFVNFFQFRVDCFAEFHSILRFDRSRISHNLSEKVFENNRFFLPISIFFFSISCNFTTNFLDSPARKMNCWCFRTIRMLKTFRPLEAFVGLNRVRFIWLLLLSFFLSYQVKGVLAPR